MSLRTRVIGVQHGVELVMPVDGMRCGECGETKWPTFKGDVPKVWVCALCRSYSPEMLAYNRKRREATLQKRRNRANRVQGATISPEAG